MRRVLSEVSAYVGILEFDAAALARARTNARLFFDELTSLGRLWEVNGGLIRIACFERLRSHTDLIIASPTSFDHFALPALVRMLYRLNRGEPKGKDMEGACHGPR